jgi:hypothetical protein
VHFSVRLRAPFSLRRGKPASIAAVLTALLWVLGLAGSLYAATAPTNTAISVTQTDGTPVLSVPAGTIVVLTANVTQPSISNPNVTAGLVEFCDADAVHCVNLLGAAQLRSNGTAVFKFRPSPGVHNFYAQFVGTGGILPLASSQSPTFTLTVTAGPFTTSTGIAKSGSAGSYSLTATVSSTGAPPLTPSGTVSFLDTSNSNYDLGSTSLLAGPSTATYAPFVSYYGGYLASSVFVADLNQDGIPDLITINNANTGASTDFISVLLGKGDGTFQGAHTYANTNGDVANVLAVGDVNGDGYPDVIVGAFSSQSVYVFMNDGKGDGLLNGGAQYTFNFPLNEAEGPMGPAGGIAIGDVNRDGKPDVVLTFPIYSIPGTTCGSVGVTGGCGAIGVMIGNGDGTFQMGDTNNSPPWVPVYASGFPGGGVDFSNTLVLADLRGIGILDAVTTQVNVGQVCVALGVGDGTFANPSCYIAPAGGGIAVGDFNGDGILDLVSANSNSNGVSVLLGNGNGTFQNAITNFRGGTGPEGLAVGDMNGDGKLDVVTGNDDGTMNVQFGNGDGTFGAVFSGPGGTSGNLSPYNVLAADLNGDGVPDVVTIDSGIRSANALIGSLTTTATATIHGVSPVGPATATDQVKASYEGDDLYSPSASATTGLTAQPVATTLVLQSSAPTVTVGGQATLTATLSPGSAQGYSANSETVTFYNNGSSIGTATLTNGVATLQPHLNAVQTALLTASYGGDSNFLSSSSGSVQVTVQKATTTLTIQVCGGPAQACPASTSAYGYGVLVTATLTPYNVTGGSSSDGEPVSFFNNGTLLGTSNLKDGSTTFVLDEPNVGSYSFTASYGGDASFIGSSTSSASSFTLTKATSNLGLQASPSGAPIPYGQTVFLTAMFLPYQGSSDTVNGETVTFYDNGNSVGTATLAGLNANLTLNNLPVGNHSFSAAYGGDANFIGSSSATPVSLQIVKRTTTLGVTPSPGGSTTYGAPITVQAFLSPSSEPGGNTTDGESVTFLDNGNPIGTGTLSHGSAMFTLSVPPSGNNAFSAQYAGDSSFLSSSAIPPVSVLVQAQPTSIGIVSNAPNNTIGAGQPVTFTANLYPYAVAGGAGTNGEQVTFMGDGNPIGAGTLANGIATYTTSSLTAGYHTFSVSYAGDGNFGMSNASVPVSVLVLPATTLTLTANPANFAALNQAISLTATLSPYSANGNSTNGELVLFYNGTTNIGNAPLSNGVATFNIPNGLPQGAYSFTAVYQGDPGLAGSNTSANPLPFSVATVENFVVNYPADDLAGNAANCTPQDSTTSNTRDSQCSLRDALLAAAAAPEGANVTFDTAVFAGPATINLINGTLTVPSNTTLTGPTLYSGANLLNLVTINGGGAQNAETSGVFSAAGTGAEIKNLVITGGYPVWNGGNPLPGGGISNSGSLTVTNCEITGNGDIESGGGIYNTGTLTIIGSTIDNNQGAYNGPGNGGGIDNENNGTLNIVNSTIANNYVRSGYGGGIYMGSGSLTMTNSTVSGNYGARKNGIDNEGSGAVLLYNSIVSYNVSVGWSDIYGNYTDKGGNIIGVANGTTITNANSLKLGALGDNGGPTPTMLPLPGSIAICGGTITNSPNQWEPLSIQIDTDQRGFLNYTDAYRLLGGPALCVDAGAVQTSYTAIQFLKSSYSASLNAAVNPPVVVGVTENGQNRGSIPITLNYSGPGNLSGNTSTTVEGIGATFSGLSVDTAGSGTLSATLSITPCVTTCGFVQLSASTNLQILAPVQISPGAETLSASVGVHFSQTFNVSGGSGSYQLTSSATLPNGLTLTPSGNSAGSSWTLSGTPTQSGTFSLTLTATDATYNSLTASQNYTIAAASTGPPLGGMAPPVDALTRVATVAQADNLLVSGWAFDPHDGAPVSQVQVLIDGSPVGNATLGISRPDLAKSFNNPAYLQSGWTFSYSAAGLSLGTHKVSAVASDSLSLSATIGTATITVATTSQGPPLGGMAPAVDAQTRTTTVAQADNLLVSGWAFDPQDGAPVSQVQVLIDGTPVGNATLGISRPDLATTFGNPAYLKSGWSFSYPAASLSLGKHTVSAVASDSLSLSTTIGTATITVATTSQGPPLGGMAPVIDALTRTTTVAQADNLLVSGWAFDPQDGAPLSQVQVLIDGTPVGNATLGISRPDLAKSFNNPAYLKSGWSFSYSAAGLSLGTHTVSAVASDSLSLSTTIGSATITVATTSQGPPLGGMAPVIDARTRVTTVAQADNLLVSGWAFDPQDGAPLSQVQVLIDGTPVGSATLGIPRPDLATSFNNPGYLHSGWSFSYPAAGLSLGTHTVSAVASDSLSLSTTIGTATITVATTSQGPPLGGMAPAIDAQTRTTTVAQADNLLVSGWAFDPQDGAPVSQVQVLIDGTPVGNATLGISRPDLAASFNNPAYLKSGWSFSNSAAGLSPGTHTVSAVASDSLGLSTTIGTATISVTTGH